MSLQNQLPGVLFSTRVNVSEDRITSNKTSVSCLRILNVYPKEYRAYDLLEHIALLKGINNRTERKEQILNLLEKVNLSDFQKKSVYLLGGMRRDLA